MTRLISYTTPVVDGMTLPQQLVAYCARVSNPANQTNHATADKLIKYLIKNKHWSPLEMVDATLEIVVPRDIGRQILRHASFRFQEFSQRYAEVTDAAAGLGFAAPRECRLQDEKNRQNSLPCLDADLTEWWVRQQEAIISHAEEVYDAAISRGIAKEVARVVLPEGLTLSRMYMKGSLRSWIHYIEVRKDESTQSEHRDIALAAARCIAQVWNLEK